MNYTKTFEDYTNELPRKFLELQKKQKYVVNELFKDGNGAKTILKTLKLTEDIRGLYVFWKGNEAVYVGISGNVIERLIQHIKSNNYHSATLPIKILKTEEHEKYNLCQRECFDSTIISDAQNTYLTNMSISFISIEDDLELYLFETYCAITFKCKYNDFKTH
ncbi:MAG: hypothetical protein U0V72_15380 [Cytophagales bacterium]